MNILQLSWKNITYKPLSMLLSIILFALGVGLISLLFLFQRQFQENQEKNLVGIDMVLGAKGSPLQLILSSMYHIDAPTGNIKLEEVRPFLNPQHPLIQKAVPLSMGDSYKGYRIVGTDTSILSLYDAKLSKGKVWQYHFEVTIGASIAAETNLKIGDEFNSAHGFVDDEDQEHKDAPPFKVVGILEPTGTVIDQLILGTTQSFWLIHDHDHDHDHEEGDEATAAEEHHEEHDHDQEGHDHDEHDHDHEGHNHEGDKDHDHEDHAEHDHDERADDHDHDDHDYEGHDHAAHNHEHHAYNESPKPLFEEGDEEEITALLVIFNKGDGLASPLTINLPNNINENTNMLAADPAYQINRLYALMDTGEQALAALAVIIIIVSGLSIFISLFSSLKERKYELALMRTMGATPSKLFSLIISEGLILALVGTIVGLILSHGGMELFAGALKDAYRYSFTGLQFLPQEGYLVIGALVIGFIAALLPAVQASNTDISDTLTAG